MKASQFGEPSKKFEILVIVSAEQGTEAAGFAKQVAVHENRGRIGKRLAFESQGDQIPTFPALVASTVGAQKPVLNDNSVWIDNIHVRINKMSRGIMLRGVNLNREFLGIPEIVRIEKSDPLCIGNSNHPFLDPNNIAGPGEVSIPFLWILFCG